MISPASETTPGESQPLVPVRVWDWPVRVFHWTLTALVVCSVVTAKLGGLWMDWHMRSGYAIATLLTFRIAWGFAGTRWSRWSSFLAHPAAALRYARSLAAARRSIVVGHNPLGGYMVVALIAALLLQATTGLFANDDILTEGPLAKLVSKTASDRLASIHNANQWVLYTLVALHILGVLLHRLRFGEDLVAAMITGVKRLPGRFAGEGIGATPHARAVAIAAACGMAVWWVVTRL